MSWLPPSFSVGVSLYVSRGVITDKMPFSSFHVPFWLPFKKVKSSLKVHTATTDGLIGPFFVPILTTFQLPMYFADEAALVPHP